MAFVVPFIPMIMSVAGSAMSAVGAIQAGNAQKAQQESQAQANEYNAAIARNNAMSINQQTSAKEDAQRRQFAQVEGEANASIAQNNIGFIGSSADVLKQNAINAELDALNVRYQGQQQSTGLLAQSELDKFNASQNRINGANAKTAGYIGGAANLLSGIGTAMYYNKGMAVGSKAAPGIG